MSNYEARIEQIDKDAKEVWCPILSISGRWRIPPTPCWKEQCGCYDKEEKRCAFVSLSNSLRDMAMYGIAKK